MVSSAQADVNNQTLAMLVNIKDPESLEIAKYYQQARLIPEDNIIYLSFNGNVNSLSEAEFKQIYTQLSEKVSSDIQAYVLAWRRPWRVGCMSITSAFSLGFNKAFCAQGCKKTKSVKYFNSQSKQPYTDYGFRPSIMLSAGSVNEVKRMIDRGVAADYLRPTGTAYLLSTSDKMRNVRAAYYSAFQSSLSSLLNVEVVEADAIMHKRDIMFYFTGRQSIKWLDTNSFKPGAIADHLTSSGGHLFSGDQMSILDWIDAGVTGSYGAVVEPCNYLQKFPNPGIVMHKYLSGDSLLEAYWKSVQMPGQGLFVGEPLASPYKACKVGVNRYGALQYVTSVSHNYVEYKFKNCH